VGSVAACGGGVASGRGAPSDAGAATGCAPLAACCATLTGATESLCIAVVGQDNARNCATELSELVAGGNCGTVGNPTPPDAGQTTSDGGGQTNPLSGTYKGYIESFMFPDGSDTVVMTLSFAADGAVTGTVFFGDGPALAPPTDPNVGYPPGFSGDTPGAPLEGFDFTVLKGTYAAPPRVHLQVDPAEQWKQWCELQTTIYPEYNSTSDGGCGVLLGYGCLPNAVTQFGSSCAWGPSCQQPAVTPVDCGKLALCGPLGPCECTATSCTVQVGPTGSVAFDMQLASGSLNGSTTGIERSQALNVHLTRQ
jgi:hypothetical protein